jgi:hypothetical protein
MSSKNLEELVIYSLDAKGNVEVYIAGLYLLSLFRNELVTAVE